jgi:hypothetical protein
LGSHPRDGAWGMSGKLQTIIQTNIHGLRSANDTAAFKEKEMPPMSRGLEST